MAQTFTRREAIKHGLFLSCSTPFLLDSAKTFAADALAVSQIDKGVYAYSGLYEMMTAKNDGEVSNLGFVVGSEAVAVIDTGGSVVEGKRLLNAIRAVTDRPIRYVINTHMHPDHIFGNAAFKSTGATFVGHKNLPRALAARGEYYLSSYRDAMGAELMSGIEIIPPTLLVEDELQLDLGQRKLHLSAWKPAHTDNDLTVVDAETQTIFTGDLCFVGHLPTLDGSLKGWIEQLDKLSSIAAKRVVPGHGPLDLAWPAALDAEKRYFDALVRDIRTAINEGKPLAEAVNSVAESEQGDWQLFDEYNKRNATAAYAELEWE